MTPPASSLYSRVYLPPWTADLTSYLWSLRPAGDGPAESGSGSGEESGGEGGAEEGSPGGRRRGGRSRRLTEEQMAEVQAQLDADRRRLQHEKGMAEAERTRLQQQVEQHEKELAQAQ